MSSVRQSQFHHWISNALQDLAHGLGEWRIWWSLAVVAVVTTYSRSLLGVIWIAAGFGIFIAVKLLIFGALFGGNDSGYYALYLVTGFFVWQLASSSVSSAGTVFTKAQGFIRNDPLPLSVYAFRDVTQEIINAAFTSIVVVAVFLFVRPEPAASAWLSVAALVVIVVNMVWVKLLLGVIATRYRDIRHLVATIMRVMFFLTPIFWMPDQIGEAINYLWWNPFFHVLEVFRAPLIDGIPSTPSWIYMGVLTCVGWGVTLVVYGRYRHRVVFWL